MINADFLDAEEKSKALLSRTLTQHVGELLTCKLEGTTQSEIEFLY